MRTKTAEIHLDYFGRPAERNISLYTDQETIVGNILNNSITFLKQNRIIQLQQEDVYLREMNYFMNLILNGGENINTIENALKTLGIAAGEVKK